MYWFQEISERTIALSGQLGLCVCGQFGNDGQLPKMAVGAEMAEEIGQFFKWLAMSPKIFASENREGL